MGFIKKNLLKVIEWKDDTKNTVVYRFPLEDRYEIMTGSTLVVRESQVAIFVYKGKVADVFEPGTYKLSTENLPFITKLLSLPTGFESPIKAEVYYVNTKQFNFCTRQINVCRNYFHTFHNSVYHTLFNRTLI